MSDSFFGERSSTTCDGTEPFSDSVLSASPVSPVASTNGAECPTIAYSFRAVFLKSLSGLLTKYIECCSQNSLCTQQNILLHYAQTVVRSILFCSEAHKGTCGKTVPEICVLMADISVPVCSNLRETAGYPGRQNAVCKNCRAREWSTALCQRSIRSGRSIS